MKSLIEQLNEAMYDKPSQWNIEQDNGFSNRYADVLPFTCKFAGHRKYGFFTWTPNFESITLMAADNAADLAEALGREEYEVEPIFKLKVKEQTELKSEGYNVLRIW
jgi:hypothetical protein